MALVKYEGGTYRTFGDLPTVGSRAPDVSLVNTGLQDVSLANYMGKRKVFNIFISIDRSVCGKSCIEFNRLAEGHEDIAMLMVS